MNAKIGWRDIGWIREALRLYVERGSPTGIDSDTCPARDLHAITDQLGAPPGVTLAEAENDRLRARVAELEAERFAVAEAAGAVIQAEGHNPVAAPTENVIAAIKEAVDAVGTLCDLQVLLDPHRIDTEMQYRDGTLEHGSYPEWETDYQVVRRLLAERDDRGESVGESIGEAYRDGARSMRERAAQFAEEVIGAHPALVAMIRALPLDGDAREVPT